MVKKVAQLAQRGDLARKPLSPSTKVDGVILTMFFTLWPFNHIHHPDEPDGV